MPREYTVSAEQAAVATASGDYDLLSIDAATDLPTAIKSLVIKATSELAEAQEEWLRLKVIRGHTTASSGGNAATARPNSPADAAYSGTCRTIDATIASAGTAVDIWADAFQVRAGYELFLPPEDWFWTSGAALLVVRLMAAVADDLNLTITAQIVEYP